MQPGSVALVLNPCGSFIYAATTSLFEVSTYPTCCATRHAVLDENFPPHLRLLGAESQICSLDKLFAANLKEGRGATAHDLPDFCPRVPWPGN